MSEAKRTVNINKRKRVEGETETVVYDGVIALDAPAEGETVTLADVQTLLTESVTDEGIPVGARVTQGTELRLQWTDDDLP